VREKEIASQACRMQQLAHGAKRHAIAVCTCVSRSETQTGERERERERERVGLAVRRFFNVLLGQRGGRRECLATVGISAFRGRRDKAKSRARG